MRCKNVKQIIQDVRRESENIDHDEYRGISDESLLFHINHAIRRIHSSIVNVAGAAELFHETERIILTQGQKEVPLPYNTFNGAMVADVKHRYALGSAFASTKIPRKFRHLDTMNSEYYARTPEGYYLGRGRIVLFPSPNGGELSITYVARPVEAAFATVTPLRQDGDEIHLVLTTQEVDKIKMAGGLCVVNSLGTIIQSFKLEELVLGVSSGFLHTTDISKLKAGMQVVPGLWHSTHPDLDKFAEMYLYYYCYNMVTIRETSIQNQAVESWTRDVNEVIKTAYSKTTSDIVEIPDYDGVINKTNYDGY